MKQLLLTLDYELYGDGSGNVFEHIIKPTDTILAIAEAYNAHLTIFFEVMEFWRLKEQWELGNPMGYSENPIEAMEVQLRNAYSRGHDVQLHLHPQWANAQWKGDHWEVDNTYWRLSVLSQDEIENLLRRGRQTLEDIIGCSQYKCDTLRAGGYNVQPSENIVRAMRNCGFRADSSIYPGGCEQGALSLYDYRSVAADKGMYHCGDSLESETTESDLMELPIVAFPMMRLKKYMSADRVRAIWRNRHSATKTFAAKTSTGGVLNSTKSISCSIFSAMSRRPGTTACSQKECTAVSFGKSAGRIIGLSSCSLVTPKVSSPAPVSNTFFASLVRNSILSRR